MDTTEWQAQVRRGTLDYCILLFISHEPRYGYEIMSAFASWPVIAAKESTIYPLLRRLNKENLLHSFWQETQPGAPPRKYYQLTDLGAKYLESINSQWQDLHNAITQLKGNNHAS